MDFTNQDVIGENCVDSGAGKLVLTEKDKMKVWVEHCARLLNDEFEWLSNKLLGIPQALHKYHYTLPVNDMECLENTIEPLIFDI